MDSPLVSIIIPTFNRAHLIGETLDSILAQTWTNWECVVVDDGSKDNTRSVVKEYMQNDNRIRYLQRPDTHQPGGNGARNVGLQSAKGRFVQFFDSDDLMDSNTLKLKVGILQDTGADMVVARTEFFGDVERDDYQYKFTEAEISFESYAVDHISWFTYDPLYRKAAIDGIWFNEELKAGQEYNYNCKVLLRGPVVKKIDDVLTYRRAHDRSIGKQRRDNTLLYFQTKCASHWHTYLDCHKIAQNKRFDRYSLLQCVSAYLRSGNRIELPKGFDKELSMVFGWRSLYFILATFSNKLFKRYYFFYALLKK